MYSTSKSPKSASRYHATNQTKDRQKEVSRATTRPASRSKGVTAAQIRAARHLAGLSQADIAVATGLSSGTIKKAESDRDISVSSESVDATRKALEKAGVIFVAENGEGLGVRLRKGATRAN